MQKFSKNIFIFSHQSVPLSKKLKQCDVYQLQYYVHNSSMKFFKDSFTKPSSVNSNNEERAGHENSPSICFTKNQWYFVIK